MQDKRTENDETEEPDDAKELKRRTTRKGHARAGRECDGGSHHDDGHEAQDAGAYRGRKQREEVRDQHLPTRLIGRLQREHGGIEHIDGERRGQEQGAKGAQLGQLEAFMAAMRA